RGCGSQRRSECLARGSDWQTDRRFSGAARAQRPPRAGVLPPIASPRPVRPAASQGVSAWLDARSYSPLESLGGDELCASERPLVTARKSKLMAANNKTARAAT